MAEDILRKYAIGGATRPDSFSGMRPEFSSALANLFQNAPPEVQSALRVSSGYRSPERQRQLWEGALAKYGSPEAARKWVAPPGRSQHGHGNAVDLKYLNPAAREWAHANADKFGLAFPLSNENWHVELKGARGGPTPAAKMLPAEAGGPAMATPLTPGGSTAAMSMPVAPVDPGVMAAQNILAQDATQLAQLFGPQVEQKKKDDAVANQTRRAALLGRSLSGLYG